MVNEKFRVQENCLFADGSLLVDFVPILLHRTISLIGGEQIVSYSIQITVSDGEKYEVDVENLQVKSWHKLCIHCADAALKPRQRDLITEFLEMQEACVETDTRIILQTRGWQNVDGALIFGGKTVIVKELPLNATLDDPNKRLVKTEDYKADYEKWSMILETLMTAAPNVSWELFLFSQFDILKELFRQVGYPIQFDLNVYGSSRSGKSSLVKAICAPAMVGSFSTSKRINYFMNEIQELRGCNVLFDDYHPVDRQADRDKQTAIKDRLVRMVETEPEAPSVIITSEYLEGGYSLQDREIQLFLGKNMNWGKLTVLQESQDALAEMRLAFHVQIVENAENVKKDILAFCSNADKCETSSGGYSIRAERYGRYLVFVDRIFRKYFGAQYGVNIPQYDVEVALNKHIVRQKKRLELVRLVDDCHSYAVAVRRMLDTNILQVVTEWKKFVPSYDTCFYTKRDDGIVVFGLTGNALLYGINKLLGNTGIKIDRLSKDLKEADALITYAKGNEQTKIYRNKRYYEINKTALDEFCDIMESRR